MSRRHALLAAVATPFLWTAYLVLTTDPRLPEPLGPYHAGLALWGIYLGTAGGLGLLFGWAIHRVPVTAALVPLSMLALTLSGSTRPGSLFAVNFPALFLLVVLLLVAGVEFVVRYPERARPVLTRRAVTWGLAIGVGHALLATLLRSGVFGFGLGGRGWVGLAVAVWLVVGATLEAGIPGFLAVRYRLVSPLLVVFGLGLWAAVETWTYLQALQASGAAWSAAFTPFTGYIVAWFVVVAAALAAGGLEYYIGRQWGSPIRS